jgi:hypothetical protein
MGLLRHFVEHPASVGESYVGHLKQATAFGLRMIVAGIACMLHGLFPFLCVTTGSAAMRRLHAEMATRALADEQNCVLLQAENGSSLNDRKDAERYRWLRDNPWPPELEIDLMLHRNTSKWDFIVDKAMEDKSENNNET